MNVQFYMNVKKPYLYEWCGIKLILWVLSVPKNIENIIRKIP